MTEYKTCQTCGKLFQKKPYVSSEKWKITKFCSTECYHKGTIKPLPVCRQCGKEFTPKANTVKRKSFYCSVSCFSASVKKELPKCEICGKQCRHRNRRFCSPECKKKWYTGENVYNYVGDNFRKDAYPVDYSVWAKIAKEIRERDKVCRHCGKTPVENGRALDVHHVIPYRISFDNSYGNLISLCRACHKKADHAIKIKIVTNVS